MTMGNLLVLLLVNSGPTPEKSAVRDEKRRLFVKQEDVASLLRRRRRLRLQINYSLLFVVVQW